MPRTPRIPVLLLSLVPGCYSPNDDVIASDGGGGSTDGSADSTGGTTASGGMTGPGTTDPTGDTTEDPSASTGEVSDTEADTTGGAPVCGNGEVEGDEVCDDGVNDGGYGGCTADCSSLGPHCGDDAVQGAEDCDDGDDENGDGCNIDCTVSGEIVWTRTFDGADAYDVAVDASGNVAVVTYDGVTHQFDPDGAPGWTTDYSVPGASSTSARAISFDGVDWLVGGSAVVAGQGTNSWWRRVDAAGVIGAGGTYDGPAHTNDTLGDVAFDGEGNYYVVGATDDVDLMDDSDTWIRKFDPDGAQLWTRTFDGGNDDAAASVASAPDGGVVVGGYTEVAGEAQNTWLRKYDGEGTIEWTRSSMGDGTADRTSAVAVGSDGSVASVGTEGTDVFVRLHSPGGVEMWTKTYDGPAVDGSFYSDTALGVAVDSAGAVVVTGTELVNELDLDPWVRKYDADGDVLWSASPEASDDGNQFARGVAVDSNDYVFVAGESSETGGWLVKFTP